MRYVSYLRVSTQKQGASGLGLEAQRASVEGFLRGGDELIGEFVEVESGKKNDRPQLAQALEMAKREGATLVIAKLDRLARNVAFIANLLEKEVEIEAVDIPNSNRFMFHIMAAVGEQEAKAISDRTKAALRAARARGQKLGWSNPERDDAREASHKSAEIRRRQSEVFAAKHSHRIRELRDRGKTLQQIADDLNLQGIKPLRGERWWASTVRNLLIRSDLSSPKINEPANR